MGGDRIPGPFDKIVDEATRWRRAFAKRNDRKDTISEDILKAIEQTQASYLSEFGHLDTVALDVTHGQRGGFLKKYTAAWLHADVGNKRLMKPVFQAFIRTYNLEEDPTGDGERDSSRKP